MQRIAKKISLFFIIFLSLALLPSWEEDVWTQSLTKISTLLSLIEKEHFLEPDHEKFIYAAIRGILQTLDPHSYLLEPDDFSRLTEDYRGKYSGLGIMIQKQEDRLVVISPIEGTPAYRLGIQPGDIISHIEGESTRFITDREAIQKLRGLKGTKVTITILREGMEPFDLTIVREEIPLHSVPYAFMLQDDIGYIFIRNFAETTTREFEEKMESLKSQGMKKLILDLRGNGGGTFIQSIEISDEFLPKGALIVSIKGRKGKYSREFRAQSNNQNEDLPLVILIDRGSASAPEIVSGAVRDNDRGLIIGEDSWGKGLVQTVFRLEPDVALALTTARYYTPSGSSIQRDYTQVDDYLFQRGVPEEKREVKYTAAGRKVLGQGGISPDIPVEFTLKPTTASLRFKGAFFTYATNFANRKTTLAKRSIFPGELQDAAKAAAGRRVIDKNFTADSEVLEDFKSYLTEKKIDFESEKFEEAQDEIAREIEREISAAFWGIEQGMRAFRRKDPVVLKAIGVLPQGEALLKNRRLP